MELKNDFEVSTGVDEAWSVLTDVERIAPCLPGAELREIDGEEYRGVVKVKVGPISAEYRGAAHFVELDAKAHRAVLRAEGREARGQGNAAATITATLKPAGKGTKVTVLTDLSITGKVAQFGRGVLADVSAKLLSQFVDNLEATVLAESRQEHADGGAAAHLETPGAEGAAAAEEEPAKSERPSRKTAGRAGRRGAAAREEDGEASHDEAPPETEEAAEPAGKAKPKAEPVTAGVASSNGAAAAARDGSSAESGAGAGDDAGPGAGGATVRRLEPAPAEPVDLFEVAGPSLAKRLVPLVGALALLVVLRTLIRRKRS